MAQVDLGTLSNILGLLLALLSIILTILVALIGYFLSKFNHLINSVDEISNELESLNDTNDRIEQDLDEISTTIVRIEERTRGKSDGNSASSDGSGFPLLDEPENIQPHVLNISILSASNEIFGENYESIFQEIDRTVDDEPVQLNYEYRDPEQSELALEQLVQSAIWIISPEVFRNDEIKRVLESHLRPMDIEVIVPLESGYEKESFMKDVHSMDGFVVGSKEALIVTIQAYINSFEFDEDAREIWRTEILEIDDVTKA